MSLFTSYFGLVVTALSILITILSGYIAFAIYMNKRAEKSAKTGKRILHVSLIVAFLFGLLSLTIVLAYVNPLHVSSQSSSQTISRNSATTTPQDTASPTLTTDAATPSPPIVATATTLIAASTPLKTLQTLCNAAKAEDYPTQWNQFDPGFRTSTWAGGYTEFSNGLTSRDNNNGGVASCTFAYSVQSGSSARATETTTFNNGTKDIKTLQLIQEGDGVWKINNIIS